MIANWVISPCLLSQCSSQQATETGWMRPASPLTLEKTSCLTVSNSPWTALVCIYITGSLLGYTLSAISLCTLLSSLLVPGHSVLEKAEYSITRSQTVRLETQFSNCGTHIGRCFCSRLKED